MNNLDQSYNTLCQTILTNGYEKTDRTGVGTKSIFGYQIRHKMSEGFPLLTTKKMAFKQIATELVWFLKGDTNIKFLVDNDCNIWNGDAYKAYVKEGNKLGVPYVSYEKFVEGIKNGEFKSFGDLGPIYGKQWRNWFHGDWWYNGSRPMVIPKSVDQIENLINDLRENPDSRRLMVTAWNPGELDKMVLPPCHYGFQCYTRELLVTEREDYYARINNYSEQDRLEMNPNCTDNDVHKIMDDENMPKRALSLIWNQRSVDTFLGLPFNIASYGLLLQMISHEVNMIPDELIGNLGDTHIYLNHIDAVKEQIQRNNDFVLPTVIIKNGIHASIEDFELHNYQYQSKIVAKLNN